MTSRLLSAFLVIGLAFAACKNPRTEIVLSVDSDLAVPTELDAIQIVIAGGQAAQPFDQTYQLGPGKTKLPIVLGLVPGGDKGLAFRVEVSGFSGGTAVVKRSASTSFLPEQTLSLSLQLLRTCVQKPCNSGETCGSVGRCVSEAINPATLPKHGSPTGDAAVLVAKDAMEVTLEAGADRKLDTIVDVPSEVAPPNQDALVLLDVQVDTVVPREDVGSADSAFDLSPDSPFVHQDSNDVAADSADTLPALVPDTLPPKAGDACVNVEKTALPRLERQRANWIALRAGKCSGMQLDTTAGTVLLDLKWIHPCDAACVAIVESFVVKCPQNTAHIHTNGRTCALDANECIGDLRKPGSVTMSNAENIWYNVLDDYDYRDPSIKKRCP